MGRSAWLGGLLPLQLLGWLAWFLMVSPKQLRTCLFCGACLALGLHFFTTDWTPRCRNSLPLEASEKTHQKPLQKVENDSICCMSITKKASHFPFENIGIFLAVPQLPVAFGLRNASSKRPRLLGRFGRLRSPWMRPPTRITRIRIGTARSARRRWRFFFFVCEKEKDIKGFWLVRKKGWVFDLRKMFVFLGHG